MLAEAEKYHDLFFLWVYTLVRPQEGKFKNWPTLWHSPGEVIAIAVVVVLFVAARIMRQPAPRNEAHRPECQHVVNAPCPRDG